MGEQVSRIIKPVDAITVGDHVVRLADGKLLRVIDARIEYDYDLPRAVWLSVVDLFTATLQAEINSADVSWPLTEMEVLAWASK